MQLRRLMRGWKILSQDMLSNLERGYNATRLISGYLPVPPQTWIPLVRPFLKAPAPAALSAPLCDSSLWVKAFTLCVDHQSKALLLGLSFALRFPCFGQVTPVNWHRTVTRCKDHLQILVFSHLISSAAVKSQGPESCSKLSCWHPFFFKCISLIVLWMVFYCVY